MKHQRRTEKKSGGPEKTLADYAEEWWAGTGRSVPARETDAWRTMYNAWVTWAFGGWEVPGGENEC